VHLHLFEFPVRRNLEMNPSPAPEPSIRFGDFELLPESGELKKTGTRIRLSGQAFDTLVLLVEARGQIVSREQLQKALWSDSSFGDFEHGLNAAINRLRGALGDSATDSRYVETVPRRGYRFIHPLIEDVPAAENGHFHSTEETAQNSPVNLESKRGAARYLWRAVIFAILIVVAGIWIFLSHRSPARLADLKETPLTTLPGLEISPAFSPDGSQIAFGWDGENNGAGYDLYVQTVGAENPHRLTHNPVQSWFTAAWSPDGRFIAVRSQMRDSSMIELVPATGGPPRPLVAVHGGLYAGLLSWSRDSKTIAFAEDSMRPRIDNFRGGLYFLPLDTQQPKFVETHCGVPVLPRFNPQRNSIAFACIDRMDRSSIEVLDVDSGRVDQLLSINGTMKEKGLDWSADGRFLFFSYTDPDGGSFIWETEAAHPEHRWRLPLAHDAGELAVSRAGDSLAYVQSFVSANIWKLNLTGQPAAQMLIASTRSQNNPNLSPDGSKIAFESDRSGSHEVWISDAEGHNVQQVSHLGSLTGTPSWSPDSKLLAFDSRAEGEANLYVYNTAGGDLRKLATSTRANSLPAWSKDGRFLFYASGEDIETTSIWRAPVEGGTATEIVADGDLPILSPDGIHLFFRRFGLGSVSIMRVRLDGTDLQTVQVLPVADSSVAWFPSGGGLYILSAPSGTSQIEYLDIATKKRTLVYTLPRHALDWTGGLSVSSDGKSLLFTQVDEQKADLYLLTGLNSVGQR
jgi:Tol biopolymer transport system component/DNA-binding winged helix-turn-helix (wHTH) protein